MNQEIKAKWISALKSGEYIQGQHRLRNTVESGLSKGKTDTYCCLGVLCDIYHKTTGDGKWSGSSFTPGDNISSGLTLPFAVKEWAGLNEQDPQVIAKEGIHKEITLSILNDEIEYTFEQIAQAIEENL